MLPRGCMQGPVTMDHVLLEWDGACPEVLARVRDDEGCWLVSREVNEKLCSSVLKHTWYQRIKRGEQRIPSCCRPWVWRHSSSCLAAPGCS